MLCVIVPLFLSFLFCFVFVFVFMPSLELCRYPFDLFLSSRSRTVPDWQPRILLRMVEARSVDVKNTTYFSLSNNFKSLENKLLL